jgi:hypothetical protein
MGSWVVEKKERGLNEQGLAESDPHAPSSRHILGFLLDRLLVESETGQDKGGSHVKGRRVHFLHTLNAVSTLVAESIMCKTTYVVDIIKYWALRPVFLQNVLCVFFQPRQFILGFFHNPVQGT